MAQLLMYEKPVVLDKKAHAKLCFKPLKDYSFAREVSLVPLMAVEFPAAAGIYPILLAQPKEGEPVALAVLSVTQKANAYVDAKGRWTATYVPAFIRSYPWVLAAMPGKNDLGVAFDMASNCFKDGEGAPLFDGDQPSKLLAGQIDFLKRLHAETRRTKAFLEALVADELLMPYNVDLVRGTDKKRFAIRDMRVVDEAKLLKLAPKRASEYLKNGWMAFVYSRLLSLRNLPSVGNRSSDDESIPWWAK